MDTPPRDAPIATGPQFAGVAARYALARLGLLAVIAGLLVAAGTPVLVALLVGLVVALPLSMLVFRGLRERLDAALAERGRRRSSERAALRAGLRGDDVRGDDVRGDDGRGDDGRGDQAGGDQARPVARSAEGAQDQRDRGEDRPAEQQ